MTDEMENQIINGDFKTDACTLYVKPGKDSVMHFTMGMKQLASLTSLN